MATSEPDGHGEVGQKGRNLELLEANLHRIEELSQRLVAALAAKRHVPPSLQGPSQGLYAKAATAWMAGAMQDPAKMIELQAGYWGKTLAHFAEAQAALAKGEFRAPEDPGPRDKRFSNPLWDTHPWFNLIKKGKWNASAKNIALSILNAVVFCIGIAVLGCGTYASVQDIVNQYNSGDVRASFTCDATSYT